MLLELQPAEVREAVDGVVGGGEGEDDYCIDEEEAG
jgi:hypothetical protein